MASRRRSRGKRLVRAATAHPARLWAWCRKRARHVSGRVRPWRPAVAADVKGKRGRRLRRAVARVTRWHFAALGVTPPAHLLVVVQRTVVEDGRPLAALLEVFEDGAGRRRHVLFLALTVEGKQASDEEVIATLRQQLQRVVADELGTLRMSVALEATRLRPVAAVVPLRREPDLSPFEDGGPPLEAYRDDGAFAVAER